MIKRTAVTAVTAIRAMMLPLRLESAEDEGISVISTTLESVGDGVSVGEDIQYHNCHLYIVAELSWTVLGGNFGLCLHSM